LRGREAADSQKHVFAYVITFPRAGGPLLIGTGTTRPLVTRRLFVCLRVDFLLKTIYIYIYIHAYTKTVERVGGEKERRTPKKEGGVREERKKRREKGQKEKVGKRKKKRKMREGGGEEQKKREGDGFRGLEKRRY